MLHLLRLIRKDLIQVNNVKKYFLYAFGEILLIVAGILIAVQIGDWNQERKERLEEREILTRISNEVAGHVEKLSSTHLVTLAKAKAALERTASVFEGEPISDNVEFLSTVYRSSSYAFAMPIFSVSTYEEILSSGKLGIIRRDELRDLISDYYRINENTLTRGEGVPDEYGLLSFRLVPREELGINRNTPVDTLDEETVRKIVASVLESELHRYLIPKRNRLNFIKDLWTTQLEQGNKLLEDIEAELERM